LVHAGGDGVELDLVLLEAVEESSGFDPAVTVRCRPQGEALPGEVSASRAASFPGGS
jgi:hypothetical protein